MPTYLRWIAALTTGISAQLVFFILVGALAVGTDNTELTGGVGAAVAFGLPILSMLTALAVNDWLAKRYPPIRRDGSMGKELHPSQPAPGAH